ncbi:hypothetical protein [Neobacillus kokaensis]|nr:hypothetical protein [Neobacillus kokaensis]
MTLPVTSTGFMSQAWEAARLPLLTARLLAFTKSMQIWLKNGPHMMILGEENE